MKHIDCYLDFLSPCAWLAFEQLPRSLEGLAYAVTYRPICLTALRKQHGQTDQADLTPPQHDNMLDLALRLADTLGVPLQRPASYPFRTLPLLRLAWACARQGAPNRWVCEQIMRHVWQSSEQADAPARLASLSTALAPARDPSSDEVQRQLNEQTHAAATARVTDVPSFVVDGRLFQGLDALPLLRAHLADNEHLPKLKKMQP